MRAPRIIIVDTIAASAADWIEKNQYLYFKGEKMFRYIDIDNETVSYAGPTAEVLQADIVTPVGTTNSITYAFYIDQIVNLTTGETVSMYVEVTTPDTGSITPTTIVTQMKNYITTNGSRLKVTPSGTSTLVLTGQAGAPMFTVTPKILGGGLTVATGGAGGSTAGVRAVGDAAYMNRLGLAGLYAGTAYKVLQLVAQKPAQPLRATSIDVQPWPYIFLISSTASNYAALNTRIVEWLQGKGDGGTVSDLENLALTD